MRKPVLTIFYQHDPWNATIGGIQTIIGSFIKYAPQEFRLRFVGVTSDSSLELRRWHNFTLKGREVLFLPLFYLKDDNHRKFIPTTLRYTAALVGQNLSSDFMHFHRLEPSLAAASWLGEKTLFVHNDIHSQMLKGKKPGQKGGMLWNRIPKLYLALESRLLHSFEQVLSCNSDSCDFYRTNYADMAERIAMVRNTVDGELFYPLTGDKLDLEHSGLRKQLGVAPDTKFILFAGRLHPQKDPLLLAQAFRQLRKQLTSPNVHLLIAGDGELMEPLKDELERLEITSAVSLLGPVPQEELIRLHQCASVCVLTSRYEGLPLVVLEALACGTPVVTTHCGETPKLLSPQSGVVCTTRSPESIAAGLMDVLEHTERFPQESCLRDAEPYQAKQVIRELYGQMLERWEAKATPVAV